MTLALPSCQADTDAPLLVPARVHSNRATHAGELPCRSGRWKEASATVRRGIPRCCTAPSLLRFTWQSSCFHADCGRGATGLRSGHLKARELISKRRLSHHSIAYIPELGRAKNVGQPSTRPSGRCRRGARAGSPARRDAPSARPGHAAARSRLSRVIAPA
uniref:Uncharacterized protein n=1 Tax=Spironucleus salmonicida TaxID=348837 RepID=V6LRU1_9EUKA|eukprot:EST47290.1 Hypothetical protein SS50377_12637 [Spironucleus salmonicida]